MTQVWRADKVLPVTAVRVYSAVNGANFKFDDIKEGVPMVVCGRSKGKGFQGVVKRHGFHGGPASHGQKHTLRTPGSIGATGPQRVSPGQKMPGRMGNKRITLKSVSVVAVEPDSRIVLLKGALPGMNGSKIELRN